MKYFMFLSLLLLAEFTTKNEQRDLQNKSDFISLNIKINASAAEVWDMITNPQYARILGSVFAENAFQNSDWQLGSDVHFTFEPDNIVATGTITKRVEHELIHVEYDFDGFEYTEQYSVEAQNGGTLLELYAGPYQEDQYDAHYTVWENWLQKVKELSETE